MARQKLVLTYRDYLKMPDDRTREEIIGGGPYVTATPSPLHQRVVVRLVSMLVAVQGAPDVVIEVRSPSTLRLDRERKMDLYARAGVRDYWTVDPKGRFQLERRFQEGLSIQSDLIPGLGIDLHDVWN